MAPATTDHSIDKARPGRPKAAAPPSESTAHDPAALAVSTQHVRWNRPSSQRSSLVAHRGLDCWKPVSAWHVDRGGIVSSKSYPPEFPEQEFRLPRLLVDLRIPLVQGYLGESLAISDPRPYSKDIYIRSGYLLERHLLWGLPLLLLRSIF